jgi:hypothetical protein
MVERHGTGGCEPTTNEMIDAVNVQINNLFASNNVIVDGPGEEAFWNAVEDVDKINLVAGDELRRLSDVWLTIRATAREGLT